MSDKKATIFDHLDNITVNKKEWDKMSDEDQKAFVPYLINRWLSMNMDYIDLVNELQKYSIGLLNPSEVYKLYFDILPKKKTFNKYIKGKKAQKYSDELVKLVSKHYLVSESEAIDYLEIYFDKDLDTLKDIIKLYGKTDKDITKLLKIEK
jgi:hypothetical protein